MTRIAYDLDREAARLASDGPGATGGDLAVQVGLVLPEPKVGGEMVKRLAGAGSSGLNPCRNGRFSVRKPLMLTRQLLINAP